MQGHALRARRAYTSAIAFAIVLSLLTACGNAPVAAPAVTPSTQPPFAQASVNPSLPEGVIGVSLSEMDLLLTSTSAPAGEVTFQIRNAGELPHELVVIRTEMDADELPVEDVKVVERGLDVIARSEHIAAAQQATLTVDLEPGHYVLICNLSGHYEESQFGPGMRANFDVS